MEVATDCFVIRSDGIADTVSTRPGIDSHKTHPPLVMARKRINVNGRVRNQTLASAGLPHI
jgi:hypothetical protein